MPTFKRTPTEAAHEAAFNRAGAPQPTPTPTPRRGPTAPLQGDYLSRFQELHEREQYWFGEPTLGELSQLVSQFEHPLGICCPMLGQYIEDKGHKPLTVLDIDDRFHDRPWCHPFNLWRPTTINFHPDLIVIDPPFTIVRLDTLWKAIRLLTDFSTPLIISWPKAREIALLATFRQYNLQSTGVRPHYVSAPHLNVEFYATPGEHMKVLSPGTRAP